MYKIALTQTDIGGGGRQFTQKSCRRCIHKI